MLNLQLAKAKINHKYKSRTTQWFEIETTRSLIVIYHIFSFEPSPQLRMRCVRFVHLQWTSCCCVCFKMMIQFFFKRVFSIPAVTFLE